MQVLSGSRVGKGSIQSPSNDVFNSVTCIIWPSRMYDSQGIFVGWEMLWGVYVKLLQENDNINPKSSRKRPWYLHQIIIFHLKKNLLVCHWVVKETECLIIRHQVTMWPKLCIMNWVLSDPVSHKIGWTQQIHHETEVVHLGQNMSRDRGHKEAAWSISPCPPWCHRHFSLNSHI